MSDDNLMDEIFPTGEPTEEVAEQSQPRDEQGRFAPKGDDEPEQASEPVESAPPAPEPEPDRIPIAALKDERSKRQQAEQRAAELEAYLQQLQTQQQQPDIEPDMFADPDGFKAHLVKQLRQELMQELQPTMQQQQVLTRAEVSEMMARQRWQDYDAKVEVFKEALQGNPFLVEQLKQAPDPATFAYNAALKYEEAKQYGTASPSRDQIKAELREELMNELGLNRPKVPTTLAGDRSVGSRSGPAWSGPVSVDDIFPR